MPQGAAAVARPVPLTGDRPGLGLALMLAAVSLFACIDTSAKWLIVAGLPALQVAFVRYAGHLALALALCLSREGPRPILAASSWLQVARALALAGSTSLNFLGLQFLPLTTAVAILFAAPIVVTLLAIPLLGERVGPRRLAAVGAGFLGVLVVVQPWGASWHPAILLSLGALLSASLYYVLTRMVVLRGERSVWAGQVWVSGLAAVLLAPFALAHWSWPAAGPDWFAFGLIGLVGGTSHALVATANRWAGASVLTPVTYLHLPFVTVLGFVLFGTRPAASTLLGAAIIVGASAYLWRRDMMAARQRAEAR